MRLRMLTPLLLTLCTLASAQHVTSIAPDGKVHKFEARDRQFFIDGQPTLLVSGEMHFGRVLPEDWETRIKQAKAMGLNTMSFYLFWNMCEPKEGAFSFTGMTDVRRMLQLCQENGMWAILRPGPYCCAEIDYGGIPWWTAKYPGVRIRSTDPKWMEWSKRYIEQVYKQVGDLQVSRGGPLLMVQMDNEYGMISDRNDDPEQVYIRELQKIFQDAGFDVQLFTCDPRNRSGRGTLPGVLRGPNGYRGIGEGRGGRGGAAQPPPPEPAVRYPIFVPELYTNWFSGWGAPINTRNKYIMDVLDWTAALIEQNCSFNYYMFFGGTTWGYWNGCNQYLPLQTSYNYSAPIDEAGRTTAKYDALRSLLTDKLSINPPQPPPNPRVIVIPRTRLNQTQPMLEMLPATPTRVADQPLSMEDLDQAFGFVDYRKRYESGLGGTLVLKNPMDYAIVMVNGKTVGKAFRGYGEQSNTIELPPTAGPATLDILVYNLGRISVVTASWTQDRARKGLIGGVTLNGESITGWEMYSLPFDSVAGIRPSEAPHTGPTFYHGSFTLDTVGGSFLDLRNWSFGVVWVNGHHLGRYWDRGGLRSLFVPSHWLKQGTNDIIVLELHDAPETARISGGTEIIEEQPVPFDVRLDPPTSAPSGRRPGPGTLPGARATSQPVD